MSVCCGVAVAHILDGVPAALALQQPLQPHLLHDLLQRRIPPPRLVLARLRQRVDDLLPQRALEEVRGLRDGDDVAGARGLRHDAANQRPEPG